MGECTGFFASFATFCSIPFIKTAAAFGIKDFCASFAALKGRRRDAASTIAAGAALRYDARGRVIAAFG